MREALRQAGRLEGAWYVERASTGRERRLPVSEVDPDEVPYFSMVLVPGPDLRADAAQRALSGAAAPEPGPPRSRRGGCWSSGSARVRTAG